MKEILTHLLKSSSKVMAVVIFLISAVFAFKYHELEALKWGIGACVILIGNKTIMATLPNILGRKDQ